MDFLEIIFFPPGIIICLLIIALLLWHRKKLARNLLIASLSIFLLSSLTLFTRPLLSLLESYPALTDKQIKAGGAQAIVVLGAGRYAKAPEYSSQDTISLYSWQRVAYAASLAKKTGLKVITSGGSVYGSRTPESVLLKNILETQFNITTVIPENKSKNTFENALYTKNILDKLKIKKIILVTHAFHMRRALYSFSKNNIAVIPAPVGFHTSIRDGFNWTLFLPKSRALVEMNLFLHEVAGLFWYKIRY